MTTDPPSTAPRPAPYDLVLESADYPPWSGPPSRTLLICTQQRSGSTLLGEAIYFAGGFGCPLEYFHGGFRPSFERRWKTRDLPDYVSALQRCRTDPSGALSVKLFWWDLAELVRELAPTEFAALADANASYTEETVYRRILATISGIFPNPTFVFLTRQDEKRQAVSNAVASQSRAWRQFRKRPGARADVYDFHRIVQRLMEIQNDNRHWRNFFRANALQHHMLTYEALSGNYEQTLGSLFAAIGRADAPICRPRLQKQADEYSEKLLARFLAEFRARSHGEVP